MPKKKRNEYPDIKVLPEGARKISVYAKDEGIAISPVYARYATGKIQIVTYHGINFVLPS